MRELCTSTHIRFLSVKVLIDSFNKENVLLGQAPSLNVLVNIDLHRYQNVCQVCPVWGAGCGPAACKCVPTSSLLAVNCVQL